MPQAIEDTVRRVLSWYLHTADATASVVAPYRERVPLDPPEPGCEPVTSPPRRRRLTGASRSAPTWSRRPAGEGGEARPVRGQARPVRGQARPVRGVAAEVWRLRGCRTAQQAPPRRKAGLIEPHLARWRAWSGVPALWTRGV